MTTNPEAAPNVQTWTPRDYIQASKFNLGLGRMTPDGPITSIGMGVEVEHPILKDMGLGPLHVGMALTLEDAVKIADQLNQLITLMRASEGVEGA